MIPRIAAIALLSMRAALRSRLVLTLAALLLLALAGLPGWLRGDGTANGTFTLLVGHTLAACFFLLAATSLGAGCAAIAVERGAGSAVLTAVKPVRPLALWFGKWIGIVLLDAALLLVVILGLRLQLLLRAPSLPADWRRCDRIISCVLPDPAEEAARAVRALRREGRLPADRSAAEARADLERELRNRYTLIHPGESRSWRFILPRRVKAGRAPVLRAVFETPYGLREETAVALRAWTLAPPGIRFEAETALMAGETLTIPLPPGFGEAGATVETAFQVPPGAGAPLLLHPGRNLALLLPGGSFERNAALAALILLAALAALAACGLALGSCFSFPVASFAATALILLALLGSCASGEAAYADESPGLAERAGRGILLGASAAARPLLRAAPIGRLTRREAIAPRSLVAPLFAGFVAAPALLALFSAVVLTRRENGA